MQLIFFVVDEIMTIIGYHIFKPYSVYIYLEADTEIVDALFLCGFNIAVVTDFISFQYFFFCIRLGRLQGFAIPHNPTCHKLNRV